MSEGTPVARASGAPGGISGTGRTSSFWSRKSANSPTLFLTYLAVGLLLAEGALGGVLVFGGASLLRPSEPSGGTGVQVPNGPDVSFELKALLTGFVGVNGSINGVRDPTMQVGWGDHVTLTLIDGQPMEHNLHLDGYNLQTTMVSRVNQTTTLVFQATTEGTFFYYCAIPGHRESGMQGLFVVGPPRNPIGPEANLSTPFVSHDPTAIPPPITRSAPATVEVYLEAVEETAEIEPGVSYTYWTYNGTVPGPFLRVRLNDTVEVHFYNDANSSMNHSVDFHAVTGPGGGAAVTQTPPGEWRNFTFTALMPGLFVYHCGTPNIPTHIANGMFGMILVQPPQGLAPVDHEFYLMESELYTQWPIHTLGNQLFNGSALFAGEPTYVVFGGRYDAYTGTHALHVAVNDSVRIFFGEAGPDFFSAFHMIGAMFDESWLYGDLTDPPLANLQTVPVPPGSTTMVEFTAMFPGNYPLVDHQIANAIDKGAYAVLNVTGWVNHSIFHVDAVGVVSTSGAADSDLLFARPSPSADPPS